MRSRSGLAALGWACCLLCAAPAAHANHLSLDEALRRAKTNAVPVRLAEQAVAEAAATRIGAGVILPNNPRLYADYRPLAIELAGQPVDPRHGYLVGLDGQIEVSGAGSLRVAEAEQRTKVASYERDLTRATHLAQTWFTYVSAQVSARHLAAVQDALTLQERITNAVKERARLGVAADPDVAVATAEFASVKAQLFGAKREQTMAFAALAAALDQPSQDIVTLDALADSLPAVADVTTLVAEALERRPELAATKARVALYEKTEERLSREVVPRLGYNAGLDAAPASPVFAYVGLSVELPFAQRNQGPRAVARAQKDTEQVRLEGLERSIARDVAAVWNSLALRRSQLESLSGEALPSAEHAVMLVEEGYRAGRFELFRLTTVIRDVLRIRQERLQLMLAAWADYIELQRASGRLDQ